MSWSPNPNPVLPHVPIVQVICLLRVATRLYPSLTVPESPEKGEGRITA